MIKVSRKPSRVKLLDKKGAKSGKLLAAKVLIEQTKGIGALSHREKRVAAGVLAQSLDSDGARIPRDETSQVIQRPHVRDVLVEALATIGVNPSSLAKVLAEGLKAETTKFFAHEGMVVDSRDVIDHPTRHKFLETALSVVGVKSERGNAPPPSNVFVFRSFLGDKPVDVEVGAPTDAIVSRRLAASKVRNRSHV